MRSDRRECCNPNDVASRTAGSPFGVHLAARTALLAGMVLSGCSSGRGAYVTVTNVGAQSLEVTFLPRSGEQRGPFRLQPGLSHSFAAHVGDDDELAVQSGGHSAICRLRGAYPSRQVDSADGTSILLLVDERGHLHRLWRG